MTDAIRYRRLVLPALAVCWVLFKICYPYPDFFTDSYTYIAAAAARDTVSYRPIGYSLFLRLVHSISHSDDLLVTLQFILLQASCWHLFREVRRHCAPLRGAQRLIVIFLILNPPVYYIANCISSDALFIALSLFWFTAMLRLAATPRWADLFIQAELILLATETRYMALFYPLVAVICFLRIPGRLAFRLTGIGVTLGIAIGAIVVTRAQVRAETGAPVFSAFGGWEIANNALRVYFHVPVDTAGLPSPETATLATYVSHYFKDEAPAMEKNGTASATDFMWEKGTPLHRYFDDYRRRGSWLRSGTDSAQLSYFRAWNRVAPVFSQYGYFVVRRHPMAFARYYLLPSAGSFFLSPLEVFAAYNGGKKDIDAAAKNWFRYHSTRPSVCSVTLQGKICWIFPWLSLLLYLAGGATAIVFACRRRLRSAHPVFARFLGVAALYLTVNACFNIFAAFSVYRYQVVPLVILFIFTISGLFFVTCFKQPDHV